MPVIDDLSFAVQSTLKKIIRIEDTALKCENEPANEKLKNLLKVMSDGMDDLLDNFSENIGKIAAYNAKQSPRIEKDMQRELEEFEAHFYNAKSIVTFLFPSKDKNEPQPSTSVSAKTEFKPSIGISLPKIQLSEFDGNMKQWSNFADLYTATVHLNPQLSDVQKHMYLRSLLRGEALSIISSLPLSGANYNIAWNAVCNRYSDSNLLTNAYLEALMESPNCKRDFASCRTFATTIMENLGALQVLGHDTKGWAALLIFMLRKKLNPDLRERWEKYIISVATPAIDDLVNFLNSEARVLEAAQPDSNIKPNSKGQEKPLVRSTKPIRSATALMVSTNPSQKASCLECGAQHFIYQCHIFSKKKPFEKLRLVKRHRLCLNCLGTGHYLKDCPIKSTCKHCSNHHHSLLHFGDRNNSDGAPANRGGEPSHTVEQSGTSSDPRGSRDTTVSSLQTNTSLSPGSILLATAQAFVSDRQGQYHKVRVLIDSASEGTFITISMAQKLGLPVENTNVPIFGMAQTNIGVSKGMVTCCFKPAGNVELQIQALVVDRIARCPSISVNHQVWTHIGGLQLADPEYCHSQMVDILLGAEWYSTVIIGAPITGPSGSPSAIESIWGYCLIGRAQQKVPHVQAFCTGLDSKLDLLVRSFWEVEESPTTSHFMSPEEEECERHYQSTVSRSPSGRYIVELPFKTSAPALGDSRQAALRRFLLLERRLEKTPELRMHYNDFMTDYLNQGHMVASSARTSMEEARYYIPHHCIYKTNPVISKFRVVFDASMTTVNGPSLNQIVHVGPSLQQSIYNLLITFRFFGVVLVADVRQMYRNIVVAGKHQSYQRIFWRWDPADPLQEYFLTTVTYGVASAPYLAIRTLRQLVQDEGSSYPAASEAIMSSTYMDDIITSTPTVEDAISLQTELIALMDRAGFSLRKWSSNRIELLQSLPPEHCALPVKEWAFDETSESFTKILGLIWLPKSDTLTYKVNIVPEPITKRGILSEVARLYDPLGFLSPVTFYGKWIIQHLWQLGVSWDEELPSEVVAKWTQFRNELPELARFQLHRNLKLDSAINVELHSFADSSEKGYAGVVYLRTEEPDRKVVVSLIMAKSKVAPLKRVSLPKLELCATLLATKLVCHVLNLMQPHRTISRVNVWTDSTVALGWIQSSPHRWKTYIANRVSQIQSSLSPEHFRYVPSAHNPADCASRGLLPMELIEHPLWKSGPEWLKGAAENWPMKGSVLSKEAEEAVHLEDRVISLMSQPQPSTDQEINFIENVLNRTSSLTRFKYIVGYCLRFIHNVRQSEHRRSGQLSAKELALALEIGVRWVQSTEFRTLISDLQAGKQPAPQFRKLNPFLDDHQLVRVGGRLRNASIAYARKHPLLLPRRHTLTSMIVDFYHLFYLHPGPQNLHCVIQTQFWIMSGRDVIRRRVSKCVKCFRTNPTSLSPFMGNLPADRLKSTKPFGISGLDYGGPFNVTLGRLRNARKYKAYICLFVCFSSRAIHLELVSELSTDAFLAALRRFIARRGTIQKIYSDNGTNFVGARRKLSEWAEIVSSERHNQQIFESMAEQEIEWHFNPASGPHFAGLAEAGIKSVKQLLSRAIGDQVLTYEELNTVLIQIEATLNSRPITPMSTDPNDMQALTPAHFLHQGPATTFPEAEPDNGQINYRDRWKLLQQITRSFWKRWSNEYFCTLQTRTKWTNQCPNLSEDTLVIIRENNIPPLQWHLGRITRTYPGNDGVVRVAEVRTSKGVITRPVVKLCPLPIN